MNVVFMGALYEEHVTWGRPYHLTRRSFPLKFSIAVHVKDTAELQSFARLAHCSSSYLGILKSDRVVMHLTL